MSKFGKRVLELLSVYGISQRYLARQVGITEVTLSRYITGQRSPKAETVAKIATILHTSSDYLMGKDNQVRGTDYWETYFLIKNNKDEWSENQKAALIVAMFHKDTDGNTAQGNNNSYEDLINSIQRQDTLAPMRHIEEGFPIDLNKDSNPGQSQ